MTTSKPIADLIAKKRELESKLNDLANTTPDVIGEINIRELEKLKTDDAQFKITALAERCIKLKEQNSRMFTIAEVEAIAREAVENATISTSFKTPVTMQEANNCIVSAKFNDNGKYSWWQSKLKEWGKV